VRLMMADVLRDEGFQMIEASDAAEAISIIKTTPVDAVITDLRMSAVADGLELAAYVRAHCPGDRWQAPLRHSADQQGPCVRCVLH
jgi:CheY-like chemotaxis protein